MFVLLTMKKCCGVDKRLLERTQILWRTSKRGNSGKKSDFFERRPIQSETSTTSNHSQQTSERFYPCLSFKTGEPFSDPPTYTNEKVTKVLYSLIEKANSELFGLFIEETDLSKSSKQLDSPEELPHQYFLEKKKESGRQKQSSLEEIINEINYDLFEFKRQKTSSLEDVINDINCELFGSSDHAQSTNGKRKKD